MDKVQCIFRVRRVLILAGIFRVQRAFPFVKPSLVLSLPIDLKGRSPKQASYTLILIKGKFYLSQYKIVSNIVLMPRVLERVMVLPVTVNISKTKQSPDWNFRFIGAMQMVFFHNTTVSSVPENNTEIH